MNPSNESQHLHSFGSEEIRRRKAAENVKYTENLDDADFERMLKEDNLPNKRQKGEHGFAKMQPFQNTTRHSVEAETAWALDLNAVAIIEEEEEILPANADEKAYVQMRNYVLLQWRTNVERYLSEEEAIGDLPKQFQDYARVAWRFLDSLGYINFGVSPGILSKAKSFPKDKGNVVIIGAGLAGLSAANQLQKSGFRVLVLEGHGRPGGRVHTRKLQAQNLEAGADLGGSIITGMDGNPLAVLAKQLQIPLHNIDEAQVPLYLSDGTIASENIDEEVEETYNQILDKCSDLRNLSAWTPGVTDSVSLEIPMMNYWRERKQKLQKDPETSEDKGDEILREQLFRWHIANLEFANAADMKDLSLRSWDQDDPHELPGAHCFLPGGNIRLVVALASGLDIAYNSRVKEIKYSKKGVKVRLENKQSIKCDAVIVTESLGCQKAGNIVYKPPLPVRKRQAIQRVGFSLLNKLILLFPYKFWGEQDMFGWVQDLDELRGLYYLFYSYDEISGGPVLAALVSGQAAKSFEDMTIEEATQKVMITLRGIFTPKEVNVPDPLQVLGTKWGKDELARGSYSCMGVGTLGGEDYDILGENVGERLFFAGEATTKIHPATMHGAYLTGLREAANVCSALCMASDRKKSVKGKNSVDEMASQVVRPLDKNLTEISASISKQAPALLQLFKHRKVQPDLEFGCFSAFILPNSQFQNSQGKLAVLKIDIGAAKGRSSTKYTDIILVLTRESLFRLQDVVGGDDARFSLLASLSELKLVGRLGPTKEQLQILHAFIDKQGADLKRRLKDQPEHRQGIIHEKHRGFDTERDKSRRPRSGRGYASHQFQGQRQPHVYHNTNLPRNGPYDY